MGLKSREGFLEHSCKLQQNIQVATEDHFAFGSGELPIGRRYPNRPSLQNQVHVPEVFVANSVQQPQIPVLIVESASVRQIPVQSPAMLVVVVVVVGVVDDHAIELCSNSQCKPGTPCSLI